MDNRELPTIEVQKMDPMLYRAAMEGNMKVLTSIVEANEPPPNLTLCLTPQKNTVLHIAIKFKKQNIVKKMIQLCPSLISQPNSKGDTPLHVAARAGHLNLTKLLMPALNLNLTEGNPSLEEGNPVRQAGGVALRMSNLEGSNPIHEALKKSHGEVALHLLAFEERHGLEREVNVLGESLLYLAAEAGLDEVVRKIIDTADYSTGGPDGQNPLHIAVINGQLGVVEILLDKERSFISQEDCFGNTVLHYASAKSYSDLDSELESKLEWELERPDLESESESESKSKSESESKSKSKSESESESERLGTEVSNQIQILQLLLQTDPSLVYVPNRNGDYPLFSAIRNGSYWVVNTILVHCPDSAELVNQNGQNVFHIAVMENQRYILGCLLIHGLKFKKLVNEPDSDGNTPMHLATLTNQEEIVSLLINKGPVDLTISNKEGLTAIDICGYTEGKHRIRDKLRKSGAVPGRHQWQERFRYPPPQSGAVPGHHQRKESFRHRSRPSTPPAPRTRPRPRSPPTLPSALAGLFKTEKVPISSEFIQYGLQTLPIVTSLVATVTFAAAFTVPGGYKNDGPREGLPVLMRNTALQAFVLSDTLAFCSSMAATVLLVYANAHSEEAFKIYWALQTCYYISGVAILATITAFVTAVYVLTSKERLWLAVTSLLLGFVVPLFLLCFSWGLEVLEERSYRIGRVRYTLDRGSRRVGLTRTQT